MKKKFLLSLMFGSALFATTDDNVNAEEFNEQVDNLSAHDLFLMSFPSTIDVSTVGRGTCSEEAKDIQVTFSTFTPGDELSGDLAKAPMPPAPLPPAPVHFAQVQAPFHTAPMPESPVHFAQVQAPFHTAPMPDALERIEYPVHGCFLETLMYYSGDDCVEKMLKEKDKLNKETHKLNKETPIELMDDIIQMHDIIQMRESHKELDLNRRDELLKKIEEIRNRVLIEREQDRNNNNQNQN